MKRTARRSGHRNRSTAKSQTASAAKQIPKNRSTINKAKEERLIHRKARQAEASVYAGGYASFNELLICSSRAAAGVGVRLEVRVGMGVGEGEGEGASWLYEFFAHHWHAKSMLGLAYTWHQNSAEGAGGSAAESMQQSSALFRSSYLY